MYDLGMDSYKFYSVEDMMEIFEVKQETSQYLYDIVKQKTRVDGYLNEVISSGILDEDNHLALVEGT